MTRSVIRHMVLKVEVLDIDIEGGIRRNPHHCPIAKAVTRALRKVFSKEEMPTEVSISRFTVGFYTPKEKWRFKTPVAVRTFIEKFDDDEEVEPFTFEMQE